MLLNCTHLVGGDIAYSHSETFACPIKPMHSPTAGCYSNLVLIVQQALRPLSARIYFCLFSPGAFPHTQDAIPASKVGLDLQTRPNPVCSKPPTASSRALHDKTCRKAEQKLTASSRTLQDNTCRKHESSGTLQEKTCTKAPRLLPASSETLQDKTCRKAEQKADGM